MPGKTFIPIATVCLIFDQIAAAASESHPKGWLSCWDWFIKAGGDGVPGEPMTGQGLVRGRKLLRKGGGRLVPFWFAYRLWLRHDCVDLSAAFAYHLLQSFFPILLIALAIAGRLLGQQVDLQDRLIDLADQVLPDSAIPLLRSTFLRLTRQGLGAGLLGGVVLVMTASNAYLTLQRGADRLWWNRPHGFEHLRWQQLVRRYVLLRLKALALVGICSLLAVVDQLINTMRLLGSSGVRTWALSLLPDSLRLQQPVSSSVDLLISLVLAFLASLLVLWLLPSKRVQLRALWPGALLISVVLTALSVLLGRVLVLLGIRFQAYGVVGGVLLLTLWVWLAAAVLYYGQCLCVVLDRRRRGLSLHPSAPHPG
jgi:membrane protein